MRAALAGAVMLCLSARFVHLGRLLTMKQPVGPCLLITPWNFPLAMGTRKVGPAIAAGCTMIVKPAQQTPLSMLMLAQILQEAGLPGGVLIAVPVMAFPWLDPRLARPRWRDAAIYLAAIAAVAAPWFIAVAVRDSEFLPYFFWTHHVVRYAAPLDHAEPAWYYVPGLLAGMLPWTLLLPGVIVQTYSCVRHRQPLGPCACFLAAGFWRPDLDSGSLAYRVIYFFSVPLHFSQDFNRGLIDTRHVVLYGSVAVMR